MELSSVKRACICALCTALCYVLPLAFHALGMGSTLLPMHLPVLLCGLICGDVESVQLNRQFDCVMVYNAFPHFPNPKGLIDHLAELVQSGGRLSIAHGMSRAMLTRHHSGSASRVSIELPEAEAVAQMMDEAFRVDVVISDDTMYQVCGIKK